MFFLFIYKTINFSKIFIINLNYLLILFNNFFILLYKFNFYNINFYREISNVIFNIKVNDGDFKYYLSRKFNIFYQKKYFNNKENNFYNF